MDDVVLKIQENMSNKKLHRQLFLTSLQSLFASAGSMGDRMIKLVQGPSIITERENLLWRQNQELLHNHDMDIDEKKARIDANLTELQQLMEVRTEEFSKVQKIWWHGQLTGMIISAIAMLLTVVTFFLSYLFVGAGILISIMLLNLIMAYGTKTTDLNIYSVFEAD